jgi:hypothetical protein
VRERQREPHGNQVHSKTHDVGGDHAGLAHETLVVEADRVSAEPDDLERQVRKHEDDRAVTNDQASEAHC